MKNNKSNTPYIVNNIKANKSAKVKNSPPMKRKILQKNNVNTQQPTNVLHNIDKNMRSKRSQSATGGFGTLDPLLAAAFLASIRMSMKQKNKATTVLSVNKNMRSKRS